MTELLQRALDFVIHAQVQGETEESFKARQELAGQLQALVADESSPQFAWYQRLELSRARDKHPPIVSLHAAYSIILEELDEFWAEVKKQTAMRDVPKMIEELTQIAAMCQRTFEDLRLNERYRPR